MFKTIACVVALAAAVPAAAESRLVRYDDLNLSSPAGIERLERRIDGAARQVCGLRYDFRQSLIVQAATKKCMVEAKANAMAKVAQLETSATRGG
jgi:UrcA family protein